jgi:hypothetical protein
MVIILVKFLYEICVTKDSLAYDYLGYSIRVMESFEVT